ASAKSRALIAGVVAVAAINRNRAASALCSRCSDKSMPPQDQKDRGRPFATWETSLRTAASSQGEPPDEGGGHRGERSERLRRDRERLTRLAAPGNRRPRGDTALAIRAAGSSLPLRPALRRALASPS